MKVIKESISLFPNPPKGSNEDKEAYYRYHPFPSKCQLDNGFTLPEIFNEWHAIGPRIFDPEGLYWTKYEVIEL